LDYTGTMYHDPNQMDFTLALANDSGTSVASYGVYNCARFWENVNYTGRFIRFSRPALGGQFRDPDLRNGGGVAGYTSDNFNDLISSQNWASCG
jgi:hypothetical protein